MYYYASPEHGILEFKAVPPRREDGVQFIPRITGVNDTDHILEYTPEEALAQLCRVIENMFVEMYFYYDMYTDNEDQIAAKQAYAKGEEIWAKVCQLVVAYSLYTSRNDEVSITDCFGKKAWFNFKSQDIVDTAKSSKVKFLESTWFPQ